MRSWTRNHALQDSDGNLLSYVNGSIRLHVVPDRAILKLRCKTDDPTAASFTDSSVSGIMPATSQALASFENPVFWLAPNEWLLVSADKHASTWHQEVSGFLSGRPHVITDLSDSLAVIELAGEQSTSLLAQGCCIDLHEDVLPAGQYATTRFFQLPALIQRISEAPVFRLYIDRSEALHLWRILERQALYC